LQSALPRVALPPLPSPEGFARWVCQAVETGGGSDDGGSGGGKGGGGGDDGGKDGESGGHEAEQCDLLSLQEVPQTALMLATYFFRDCSLNPPQLERSSRLPVSYCNRPATPPGLSVATQDFFGGGERRSGLHSGPDQRTFGL
jgi:hypothetical protein